VVKGNTPVVAEMTRRNHMGGESQVSGCKKKILLRKKRKKSPAPPKSKAKKRVPGDGANPLSGDTSSKNGRRDGRGKQGEAGVEIKAAPTKGYDVCKRRISPREAGERGVSVTSLGDQWQNQWLFREKRRKKNLG